MLLTITLKIKKMNMNNVKIKKTKKYGNKKIKRNVRKNDN